MTTTKAKPAHRRQCSPAPSPPIRLAPPPRPGTQGHGRAHQRLPGDVVAARAPVRLTRRRQHQLGDWLVRANTHTVRSIQSRPVDLPQTDHLSMVELPPISPPVGLRQRIRLNRDHYVRVDTVDYSVDPHSIGRFVEATASAHMVTVCCDGQVVARHHHGDGHPVTLRALPDYDALFGVDFNPSPTKASSE